MEEVNLIERTALKIGCAVGTGAHPKKIKYKVRIFDYEAGAWSVDSSHHNLLPAQCNRDNKRKRGLFAIVTFKDEVIK